MISKRLLLFGISAVAIGPAVARSSRREISEQVISISGPREGIVNVASSNFTFSLIKPGAGTTVVTPTADFSGTWSPATLWLTSDSSSGNATFTPTQQGPTNAIGATGSDGSRVGITLNYPVYSAVTPGPLKLIASSLDMVGVGLDAWPDGYVDAISIGDGSFHFFASNAGLNSPPAKMDRWLGTATDPTVHGLGAHTVSSISNPKNTLNYMAGGTVLNLSDYGYTNLLNIYHDERWPGGNAVRYWAALGMAVSTDGGASWTDLGEIVYHNAPYADTNPPPWYQFGEDGGGGCIIWNDGYLYVYFNDIRASGQGTTGPYGMSASTNYIAVARAKITDIIASANAGGVASFMKWHKGDWTQPAIASTSPRRGGLSSPLETGNSFNWWGTTFFHTEINAIVMAGLVSDPYFPANPARAFIIQAYSPTGPFSARQIIDSNTGGTQTSQQFYVSMWCDGSNGKRTISNPGLRGAWLKPSGGNPFYQNWYSRTLSFDTTGHY